MNYFAHGFRFPDRPWYLAGTAVPDWLGVADRKVRLRPAAVEEFARQAKGPRAEIAAGVLRHLEDDKWFHGTTAFRETTGELTRLFREVLEPGERIRPGFLGHIATELLLDGLLIEEDPDRLDAYYAALTGIDAELVEETVSAIAGESADRLAWFIDRFRDSEFLRDYGDPARLRYRLNQVLGRVRLDPLPEAAEGALASGRAVVRRRMGELLPD